MATRPKVQAAAPHGVPGVARTLSIDIGGSGLKAGVLDDEGRLMDAAVRIPTPYPCPPPVLLHALATLTHTLPRASRASVGFPGMVRDGRVLSATAMSRAEKGGARDPALAAAWHRYPLEQALRQRLGIPVRLANDADVQGCAVVEGKGLEAVLTLGTGCGTALFHDGHLQSHLELSHAPFKKQETFDALLGNASRQKHGRKRWSGWVHEAIAHFDAMIFFDHLFLGGGNADRVKGPLGPRVTVVSNLAGILGGAFLWECSDPGR